MKVSDPSVFNKVGKLLAAPLSFIVANSVTANFTTLLEAYLSILLGKGAGAGWDINPEIAAVKFAISRSNPILFDLGAYEGKWSSFCHKLYPQANFFLFEPQPGCQKLILDLNLPNSILIPKAVSSKTTQMEFYSDSSTISSLASLHERQESNFKKYKFKSFAVDTITIDEIVSEYNLEYIDLMKMDIEGHELEALKGAGKSLASGMIKALTFEFGSGNVNSRTFFRDFWDLLNPLGYKIYRILPSSRMMPIEEYYEDCEYFRGVSNYLAVLQTTCREEGRSSNSNGFSD
jgi:FkbM family methyltransferase